MRCGSSLLGGEGEMRREEVGMVRAGLLMRMGRRWGCWLRWGGGRGRGSWGRGIMHVSLCGLFLIMDMCVMVGS